MDYTKRYEQMEVWNIQREMNRWKYGLYKEKLIDRNMDYTKRNEQMEVWIIQREMNIWEYGIYKEK